MMIVASVAEHPADMAHDDRRVRCRARELDDIAQLRMVEPRVEREAESGEAGEAGPELRLRIKVRPHVGAAVADRIARVPPGRVAHAAKAAAAGLDMCLEHRLDPIAQAQIGVADDARGDPGRSVPATRAHRGEASDKFRLADRTHLGGPVGTVHRTTFEKHGGGEVVPSGEIGEQLVEQVAMVRSIPEVMVGVDDRQFGIEDRLRRLLCQPRVVRRRDASPELGGLLRHSKALSGCGPVKDRARRSRNCARGAVRPSSAPGCGQRLQ
jgi:hypothetical protein